MSSSSSSSPDSAESSAPAPTAQVRIKKAWRTRINPFGINALGQVTVFGLTLKEWGLMLILSLGFYTAAIGFWLACLFIFLGIKGWI